MKRIVLVGLAACAAVALVGCASGGAGSSSAAPLGSTAPVSASSSSPSSAATASASIDVVGGEGVVSIPLDYSAGTGYEWTYSVDPEDLVAFVGGGTEDMADNEGITGGPLRDTYTFRAAKPGEVVITFDLVRGWESDEEPAETQVYAFTIQDDLKMVLNPYKSEFVNEPEWGSNS